MRKAMIPWKHLLVVFLLTVLASAASAEDAIGTLDDLRCAVLRSAGVLTDANPVPCDRLRSVRFTHLTPADDALAQGELVVLDVLAERTLALAKRLRALAFPIARAQAIEVFGGDDEASMNANNSS
ncbi:MAG: hypothetical protein V2J24_02860, partial [Pseudomonadales bacterium]|nr:hypothetical protein [Pseudomonadales bacterium]